jgi:cytochrome b involved in lipid metabolism
MNHKKIALLIGLGTILASLVLGSAVIYNLFIKDDTLDYGSESINRVVNGEKLLANNTAESCYVALGGSVYNATPVISKYPEHTDYILKACGKDGGGIFTVQKFQRLEIPEKNIEMLKEELFNYKLGTLIP